jgi:hypothetical protein
VEQYLLGARPSSRPISDGLNRRLDAQSLNHFGFKEIITSDRFCMTITQEQQSPVYRSSFRIPENRTKASFSVFWGPFFQILPRVSCICTKRSSRLIRNEGIEKIFDAGNISSPAAIPCSPQAQFLFLQLVPNPISVVFFRPVSLIPRWRPFTASIILEQDAAANFECLRITVGNLANAPFVWCFGILGTT